MIEPPIEQVRKELADLGIDTGPAIAKVKDALRRQQSPKCPHCDSGRMSVSGDGSFWCDVCECPTPDDEPCPHCDGTGIDKRETDGDGRMTGCACDCLVGQMLMAKYEAEANEK
jgi:hypothetical protein